METDGEFEPSLQGQSSVAPGFNLGRRRATSTVVDCHRPRLKTWGYPRMCLKARFGGARRSRAGEPPYSSLTIPSKRALLDAFM